MTALSNTPNNTLLKTAALVKIAQLPGKSVVVQFEIHRFMNPTPTGGKLCE
jgi:hypothetical protein